MKAKTRHTLSGGRGFFGKLKDNFLKAKNATTKTASVVGKNVVKPVATKTATKVTSNLISLNRHAGKIKGLRPLIIATGIGVLLMGVFRNRVTPERVNSSIRNIWYDEPSSAYIPEHYSRGYDTMKETLTDFGSKVHIEKLPKTITPVRTSTRDGMNTTVRGVINSNIALTMSKNAIGHWRY